MIIAHTGTDRIELRCNQVFPEDIFIKPDETILIDLVNIFLELYVSDIANKRSGSNQRDIQVSAYVDRKNLNAWEKNKKLIKKLAEFVTEGDGDKWSISFIGVEYEFGGQQMIIPSLGIDNVALLSGGLDSFCGAHNNEKNSKKTVYCGYKTSNVDISAINSVSSFLKGRKGNLRIQTYSKVKQNKIELTQRTRSLLFFSLAVVTAIRENTKEIDVNENGIMTLNPSFQSRGTTKTTHPKTIYLYQSILKNMGIDVHINHPFLFMTKGEMVNDLNADFKEHIKDTRSCSRAMNDPRYDVSAKKSCGACVPCLLRKISMAAYDLEPMDNEYTVPYAGDMDDEEYRSAFNYYRTFYNYIVSDQIFPEILIRKKFYSTDDYLERTSDMLKKFSKELEIFFKKYGR